jgi:hypothetical protein
MDEPNFVGESDKLDYKQLELRILAHMLGKVPGDPHLAKAARDLGIDEKDVTKAQRLAAKEEAFGDMYGTRVCINPPKHAELFGPDWADLAVGERFKRTRL